MQGGLICGKISNTAAKLNKLGVWLPVLLAALVIISCITTPDERRVSMDELKDTPMKDDTPMEVSFEDYWLGRLTMEEKIGQLIMPRLPMRATSVDANVTNFFAEIPFGGIILFSENVRSIEQVKQLTSNLQSLSELPLFISVDEEGGRVSRVGYLFPQRAPIAAGIGSRANTDEAYNWAAHTGQQLKELGINMNFAPVADIFTNPVNTVIGNRAFGNESEIVATMVEITVRALSATGILAVVKHFPGHGDTKEDSHFQLAIHHHGRERFDQVEGIPFRRGINALVPAVMIGHISTPAFTGSRAVLPWMEPWIESGLLPATFSDFWIREVLREEMGFTGLVITDALEMRALQDHFTCEQIALGAFLAGADILLVPSNPHITYQTLLEGFRSGIFTEERLDESVRRILRAKSRLYK
jgi:beta-N-acetylhexosaminidase